MKAEEKEKKKEENIKCRDDSRDKQKRKEL